MCPILGISTSFEFGIFFCFLSLETDYPIVFYASSLTNGFPKAVLSLVPIIKSVGAFMF
jgi:hypothetical protein